MDKTNLKEKIELQALELFKKYSYSKTSVMDIANAVGINKAVIYEYFSSKDEIIAAIIQRRMVELQVNEKRYYLDNRINFEDKLNKYVLLMLDEFVKTRDLLFGSFENLKSNVIKDVFNKFDSYREYFMSYILEMIQLHQLTSDKNMDQLQNDIKEFFHLILGRIILYFFEKDWNNTEELRQVLLTITVKMFTAIVLK
jgi:AcrR family transcriptional regulator